MALIARLTASVLTIVAAFAGLVMFSGPAHAEDGFTYWGYYHLAGDQWEASKKGPGSYTAQDGDVEGFRYASTTAVDPERPPRAVATFSDICAGTEADNTQKRIGVVLDYGTPQDAGAGDTPPKAEAVCAVVPENASTQQALESVKPLRIEDGLVCAIGGYPAEGCGDPVKNVTVPATEKPVDLAMPGEEGASQSEDGSGSGTAVAAVAAVVVLLGGGAVLVARRRT